MSKEDTAINFRTDMCVICGKISEKSTDELITVRTKGLETLIHYSLLRQNERLQKYLETRPYVVKVHAQCRKDYTRARGLVLSSDKSTDDQPPAKKLRSQSDAFSWKRDCFFCTKCVRVDERNNPLDYHFARTLAFRDSILAVCEQRSDSWALDVKGRLQLCIDLPAADAIYHDLCYKKFQMGRKHPDAAPSTVGRPDDFDKYAAFLKMCDWLESCDKLCTVVDLRQSMLSLCGYDESSVYSVQTLKRKLIERYGDHIFFGEVQGRRDVCLKDMASFIINSKWHTDRKEDVAEESERIIATAAKLIRSQIREHNYSKEFYPTATDISDRKTAKEWIPHWLNTFMEILILDEVKQVAISHSIVQSCRPRSVISPVLFGIGVQLDLLYRSKFLVAQLCRLGMSVSYDEITRFKQSVIQANETGFNIRQYPSTFTQWVADNVDHNTITLDGLNTFHGMGIIAASTPLSRSAATIQEEPILRLK